MINQTEITQKVMNYLDEKQARDVTGIDVQGVSSETDYILICTGRNKRHLQALARELEELVEKLGLPLQAREGKADSGWVLLDFNDLIIHLFDEDQREYYSLERLWKDLPVAYQS
ncbi:MAG: ribosome silencing factor [Tissierellia bacterium]|nr:ribosome silencing factor [Tissierellia bacterium]